MTKDRFQSLLINQGLHHSIADHIDESWYELFENLLPELKEVFSKLYKERYKNIDLVKDVNNVELTTIYPTDTLIFRAFKLCKLTDLKCIWLLQDPFHDGSAIGLCLDNSITNKKRSPSLQNVLNEIYTDIETEDAYLGKKTCSELEHLTPQGVLLLNTALTVEKGKPGSHLEIWKPFTEKLIQSLAVQDKIVWCLWGAKSLSFKETILLAVANGINKDIPELTTAFIISSHPSPLGANKTMQGYPAFIGSKPFSRINKYLKEWDKTEIKW